MSLDHKAVGLNLCECYTITLTNSIVARFTNHNADLTFLGETYTSIPITRSDVQMNADLQSDELQITFGLIAVTLGTAAYTIPEVVQNEYLRNAHVQLYLVDFVTPANYLTRFEGWVNGVVSYTEDSVTIGVGSLLDRLTDMFPRMLYSISCNHSLFDTYCTLDASDYDEADTVDAGSTKLKIYATVFGAGVHDVGYFSRGKITFTDGDNNAVSRTIREHKDGHVIVMIPFPQDVAVGDGFTAWPGCDGMGETCYTKFSNYANFFGFEEIPNPKILIG